MSWVCNLHLTSLAVTCQCLLLALYYLSGHLPNFSQLVREDNFSKTNIMLSGTTSTTMRHPQTQSCLMQLPAELRNRIYRDVFRAKSRDGARKVPGWDVTKRAPETIDDAEWRVTKRASTAVYRRPNMLALLQTCHLVYSEAKLIPYHINALKFGDPGEFFKFLASISHEKVSTICNVTLVVNKRSIDLHDSHSPCWTALNFLPALKILRVVVDVDGLWELKY